MQENTVKQEKQTPSGSAKPLTPDKIRAAAGTSLRKSTCVKVDGKAVHVTIKKRKI